MAPASAGAFCWQIFSAHRPAKGSLRFADPYFSLVHALLKRDACQR
jgi:hypothetical protein